MIPEKTKKAFLEIEENECASKKIGQYNLNYKMERKEKLLINCN